MYFFLKRSLDVFVGVVLFILCLPLFIIIVPLLLLTAEHKVFYKQKRIGFKNQYFDIWKFATMLQNSPNMGTGSITLRNDPRVTVMGRFLRKSKINELPQMFNLLNGTMTLVGPRPHMEFDFNHYPEKIKEKIFDIKPGITGIGSIVFRDQEQIFTDAKVDPHKYYKKYMAPYKGELEMWYQENMSLWLDIKILVLTAGVIFFPNIGGVDSFFKGLPEKVHFPKYEEMPAEEISVLS